jgi:NAD(P)-dependent dehydrogenase (short-subunit alcohol dehydrogenase family)
MLATDARARFEGRHVIVSGGAAGVGAAAVDLFAREGARVTVIDRQQAVGQALVESINQRGGSATFALADVADPAAITAAVNHARAAFGEADILYNHAGQTIVKPFLDNTLEDWNRLIAINLTSMFLMTQAVLPGMLAKGKGVIVNTSSVSAELATPMEVLYCTTKAACHMFTKAIASEYRDRHIRCNAVCPGFIRTAHGLREIDDLRRYGVNVQEQDIVDMQGRICEPEEVARAALFLASEDASFVNGECLFVDNGFMVRT